MDWGACAADFLNPRRQIRDLLRQSLDHLLHLARLRVNFCLKLGDQRYEDSNIGFQLSDPFFDHRFRALC